MTEITIHPSGQSASIPSGWDEMSPSQICFVFKTYDRCVRRGASPLEFNIRVLYHLMGIKHSTKYTKMSYQDSEAAKKISENVYWLCHNCLNWLTEVDSEGVPRLSYNSITNPLPAIRSYFGPLLIGPADILQDLTFGEFRHASAALSSFFKSKNVSDLDECIAHLYRRRCRKANRAGRKVVPVIQDKFEFDVRLASMIPVWAKNLIMVFFTNCINYLQTGKLIIDGEEIDFSLLYSGGGEKSKLSFGWNDLLVQIARDNVIGNMDRVDEEPLTSILSIMWTNYKENKKYEAARKAK